MRPLIGVTSGIDDANLINIHKNYCLAIKEAGGIPIVLPSLYGEAETVGVWVKEILGGLDGLLFSGGGDIDPVYFGEEPLVGTGQINAERDLYELSLAREALDMNLPVLAICRGMQVLNIVAGGNIWQDINLGFKNPIKHFQQAPRWYSTHTITVTEGSLLYGCLGTRLLRVNSFHHQVVRRVAPGFKICARTVDGVVEGIESLMHDFVMGVQFHPEHLWEKEELFLNLFRGFVEKAHRR
ncbi:MAG TPA: gamma-glutamyl-gamma-aminobutyrate hydrolase family protein [Clostridia bacterium]|nr:gamma-glutamyl-gamma-aminobutyrate hydrolase family protein [Clostridia bacterium]